MSSDQQPTAATNGPIEAAHRADIRAALRLAIDLIRANAAALHRQTPGAGDLIDDQADLLGGLLVTFDDEPLSGMQLLQVAVGQTSALNARLVAAKDRTIRWSMYGRSADAPAVEEANRRG